MGLESLTSKVKTAKSNGYKTEQILQLLTREEKCLALILFSTSVSIAMLNILKNEGPAKFIANFLHCLMNCIIYL